MLAYVFWHWPRQGVERAEYEARLVEFHDALRRHPPEAFEHSAAFRGGPCTWGSATEPTYEDWYLTRGTQGIDPLEQGAVHGACQSPHDAVARLAGGGCAGLYTLFAGGPELTSVRHAAWFPKPEGMSYATLETVIAPLASAAGAGVWMRKMVLGPTPEFCLLSPRRIGLSDDRFGGVVARTLEPVVSFARSS
jgi:hypothetical protein